MTVPSMISAEDANALAVMLVQIERKRCASIVMDMPLLIEYASDDCKAMAWDCYHEIMGTHGRRDEPE